jgi:hypothetical protein
MMNTRKLILGLTVVVLALVSAVAVSAAGAVPGGCIGQVVDVDGHSICFMGQDEDPSMPGWTTWTYAIRKNETLPANGLSHLVFDLCVDDSSAVIPGDGDTYETPDGYNGFDGEGGVVYDVVVSGTLDPTTLVGGIKFEGGVLTEGNVHIFRFTQPTQSNTGTIDRPVGFKSGHTETQVLLQGPICDGSSAVQLTSFSAQSMSLFSRILMWLGLH